MFEKYLKSLLKTEVKHEMRLTHQMTYFICFLSSTNSFYKSMILGSVEDCKNISHYCENLSYKPQSYNSVGTNILPLLNKLSKSINTHLHKNMIASKLMTLGSLIGILI